MELEGSQATASAPPSCSSGWMDLMPNLPHRQSHSRKPLRLHLHLQLQSPSHTDPKPTLEQTAGSINQSLPSSGPGLGLGMLASLGSCLGAVDSPTEFATSTSPCASVWSVCKYLGRLVV